MRENDISDSWVSMTGKSKVSESRGSLRDGKWWPLDEARDMAWREMEDGLQETCLKSLEFIWKSRDKSTNFFFFF